MSDTKKRFRLTGGDRIVVWVLLVLLVLTVVLMVLNMMNLRLVAGELYLFLPTMVLLLLIGWGGSALWRRMKPGGARKAVGAVLLIVMSLVVMVTVSLVSMFASINVPHKYFTVSNEGHSLVVMRALDGNEERFNARHDARLAAYPDSNPELIAEDWGYAYTAFKPALMGLFYRPDTLLEGEVYIGYTSKAELMAEWEGDVGHFFIKNPEIGDEGEMRAKG